MNLSAFANMGAADLLRRSKIDNGAIGDRETSGNPILSGWTHIEILQGILRHVSYSNKFSHEVETYPSLEESIDQFKKVLDIPKVRDHCRLQS